MSAAGEPLEGRGDESTPLWAHLASALVLLVFAGLAVYEVPHLRRVVRGPEYALKPELTVGAAPGSPGALGSPVGLAVDAAHVYVTDLDEKSLRIYSAEDGRLLETVTKGGDGVSRLKEPMGVALTPDGSIELIDSGTGRVEIYTADGAPAGFASGAELGLYSPHALAVAANGDRVFADSGGRRIVRFSRAGKERWVYKGSDRVGGPLVEPRAVAIDALGHVVFSDFGTARVHELDANGAPLRSARLTGSLMGLAVTGEEVLISAAAPEALWLLDAAGKTFRLDPEGGGSSWLSNPQGVAFDPRGRLWIVTGRQVRRYALTKRR